MIRTWIESKPIGKYCIRVEETFDGWYLSVTDTLSSRQIVVESCDMYGADYKTAEEVFKVYCLKYLAKENTK